MRPEETDKYRILKYIIIIVWLLIDAGIWYMISLAFVNSKLPQAWPDLIFIIFMAVSIPLFFILNFTDLIFTDSGMENHLLFGLIKKKRAYSDITIYSINGGNELEIVCPNLRASTFLTKESHENYEGLKQYLDKWTLKDSTPIPNNVNKWFYGSWKLLGLILFVLVKLIEMT
ncbi:MAG: hypothetical protein HYZ44_17965 [Bacteroidetes bacterium]|nr:hypothetical protein [Bacteroidota bacterium]